MSDYMKTDTKLLPYLPFPRFLLGADLTQTAKVLYDAKSRRPFL